MIEGTIYDFVTKQTANFQQGITLIDGWSWSFYDHVRTSFLYKNSQFERLNSKEERDERPFKNIIRPILNVQYRTEGFDVKDIEIYVDDPEEYHKSFLVKKFYDQWALEQGLDTFIDEVVESYVDYGGVLVKNVDGVKPEVVNLQSIAFCDQTDLLSGPFGIRHFFNPDELKKMEKKGWGQESNGATIDIDTLITLSEYNKQQAQYGGKSETPGPYIELIEVHGVFSEKFLKPGAGEYDFSPQLHIIGSYKNAKGEEIGVTLFAVKEPKLPFKLLKRDNVHGRALGFGGVEELFEAQVWTNASAIKKYEMLKLASKTLFKTTDPTFKNRNKTTRMDNGEILVLQEGRDINQLDTTPRSLVAFTNEESGWENHGQQQGGATEALFGEAPPSGTPFKSVEFQAVQAQGLHKYRQGKIAVFIDEIHRDWILPYISREIVKEQTFLAELSADELMDISERVRNNLTNKFIKEKILNNELIDPEEIESFKQLAQTDFLKTNKKFFQIIKDEFKETKLKIRANVAGKQKNLALLTDKIVNLVRQFIATPEIRQDPSLIKLLNMILESSGMSPIVFGASPTLAPAQSTRTSEPLKEFAGAADRAKELELKPA